MMVAKMIARGSVRRGLCTSSPAVETASNPIKVKKIEEAATPMPAAPKGANGAKLSPEKAVNAIMTKRISTAILMITMTAFAVADSRARRREHGFRHSEHEQAGEQLVEVLRPPNRHGGRGDAVLEEQTRSDTERYDLPHRGVGV